MRLFLFTSIPLSSHTIASSEVLFFFPRIIEMIPNSVLQGKRATNDFDVFLCYNDEDKLAVKQIGEQLKERGILPWLGAWELRPGLPWQPLLEQQIGHIKSAAVFVGKDGIGPWQRQELNAFLREFAARRCPVIPVLLKDALEQLILPIFLKGMTWVDFHQQDPDPVELLIWGITGERKSLKEIRYFQSK